MKRLIFLFIVLFSAASFAHTSEALREGLKNYARALDSGKGPMIESAIFHIAKLKLLYPEQNTDRVERKLNRLKKKGDTNTIRYKAYLAHQLLQQTTMFSEVSRLDYKNPDMLFVNLSNTMTQQLLASD